MAHYRHLWNLIRNVIGRLRFGKTAKKLIWVADELSPEKQGYEHPADSNALATHPDREPVDPSTPPHTETPPYGHADGIGVDFALKTHQDIDFTRQDNLEEYLQEITVSKETIQSWISAGILSPHDVRIAEKLIKIMRQSDRDRLRNRNN